MTIEMNKKTTKVRVEENPPTQLNKEKTMIEVYKGTRKDIIHKLRQTKII